MSSFTPTAASAMIDFNDLATQAAAGPDSLAYLKARGIDRTATLALIASAEDGAVADPFVNGHVAGARHTRQGMRHRQSHPTAHVDGSQTSMAGPRRTATSSHPARPMRSRPSISLLGLSAWRPTTPSSWTANAASSPQHAGGGPRRVQTLFWTTASWWPAPNRSGRSQVGADVRGRTSRPTLTGTRPRPGHARPERPSAGPRLLVRLSFKEVTISCRTSRRCRRLYSSQRPSQDRQGRRANAPTPMSTRRHAL